MRIILLAAIIATANAAEFSIEPHRFTVPDGFTVERAFSPTGDRFICGTFFVNPGGGQRDGILHAVHGGVWGKDHGVLQGHPRTGDLMPPGLETILTPQELADLLAYLRQRK